MTAPPYSADLPSSSVSGTIHSDAPAVSVVLPCLDEEEGVGSSVRAAFAALARQSLPGEVIVVDNGSVDSSREKAREAGARVVCEARKGYGAALRRGFREARAPIIVMADADCSYDLERLGELVQPILADGIDLVIGNRLQPDLPAQAMPWLHRHVGTPTLNLFLRGMFTLRIGDSQCGFRAFRSESLRPDLLVSDGMELASEMLIRAGRSGLRIEEVPTRYRPRAGVSKLRTLRDGGRHVRLMLLYSPTAVFQLPGATLIGLGAVVVLSLAFGPLEVFGRTWDVHSLLFGSLAMTLGTTLVLFDVLAKVLSFSAGLRRHDPWLDRLVQLFSLRVGLPAGLLFFLAGTVLLAAVVVDWLASGAGGLMAVRPVAVAMTAMVLGAQVVGTTFLMNLLRIDRRVPETTESGDGN